MIFIKRNVTMLLMNVFIGVSVFAQSIQDVPEQIQPEQMMAPMVVEFYRPSCPHCQHMAPIYSKVAMESKNGIHFYKVNTDKSGANEICKTITHNKESLSGVPTFVFVNKNGTTSGKVKAGGLSKQELQSRVAQLQ